MSRGRLGRVLLAQFVEREGGTSRAPALVAEARIAALARLLLILDGEDSVADRITLHRQFHEAARAFVGDDLKMIGLSPDHDAQRDEGAKAPAAGRERDRAGELERS